MLLCLFLSSLRMSGKSFTPRMRLKVWIPVTENSKRQCSVFPSDQALRKALYLATFEATKKWTQPILNWGQACGEMCIMYEGSLPYWSKKRQLPKEAVFSVLLLIKNQQYFIFKKINSSCQLLAGYTPINTFYRSLLNLQKGHNSLWKCARCCCLLPCSLF